MGAVCAKGIYNDDWYKKYMLKSDDKVILADLNLDVVDRKKYYQDVEKKPNNIKTHFEFLESIWYSYHPDKPPSTHEELSDVLSTAMYRDRTLPVIMDPRTMKNKVRALYS